MNRRAFVTGLAAALTPPLHATAQQLSTTYRVAVLNGGSGTANPFVEAFRQSLLALGWVEGRTITIEARFADGHMDRLALAAELVSLKPHVIVAGPSTVAKAARNATSAIPIVMAGVGDPVKLGFIQSLRHPGGNMTGLATFLPELEAKSLRLLTELVPSLNRVAILLNPDNPLHDVNDAESAAKSVGVQVVAVRARTPEDFTIAFGTIVTAQAGAVTIVPNAIVKSSGEIGRASCRERV